MKAWHFTNDTLRDGSPIPQVGQTLLHDGPLVMCGSGLHASTRITDALRYAPGHMIHRVEIGGQIIHGDDKMVAAERTIIWSIDGEALLRDFARRCALDVIPLWEAPDVVIQYLKTGDESLRDAARDATRDAAWEAAGAAAWTAAWDATRDAARDAARAAARDAAQNKRLTSMVMAEHRRTQK